MRLPYLQVTQETWENARQLEVLTGADMAHCFVALCDVWRWALSLGPEDQPPTGVCDSPRAERLLCAAAGWRGDPGELVQALTDLGLVERLPVGLRVRGMDRYKRTWEKNRRKPARTAPETGTNPAPPAPEPARQIETQTQTQKDKNQTAVATTGQSPDIAFFAWAQEQRRARFPEAGEEVPSAGFSEKYAAAVKEFGDPRLRQGYLAYLDDDWARSCSPPCPIGAFMGVKKPGHYKKHVPQGSGPPPKAKGIQRHVDPVQMNAPPPPPDTPEWRAWGELLGELDHDDYTVSHQCRIHFQPLALSGSTLLVAGPAHLFPKLTDAARRIGMGVLRKEAA